MRKAARIAVVLPLALLALACGESRIGTPEELQEAVGKGSGVVRLAAGVIEITKPIEVPSGAEGLEIIGDLAGTTLRVVPNFEGKAVLVFRSASGIKLSDFAIEGRRPHSTERLGLPPSNITFADFYSDNGLVFENVEDLHITDLRFSEITNYPIIVNASKDVVIENVRVSNSGSLNEGGRNNASGGILLENGTSDFVVRDSAFENVRGNCIWTHSRYESPRNADGLIVVSDFNSGFWAFRLDGFSGWNGNSSLAVQRELRHVRGRGRCGTRPAALRGSLHRRLSNGLSVRDSEP